MALWACFWVNARANFWAKNPIELSSKWFVTEEEYPDSAYPTYCAGWAYVTNVPTINRILEGGNSARFVRLKNVPICI